MVVKVVDADHEHILPIAWHMREADTREIWASDHQAPPGGLTMSYSNSPLKWTVLLDEKPIAMFGVGSVTTLSPIGIPWLLGTDEIERAAFRIARHSKKYIARMLDSYPHLINYVDERNELSKKWLAWCGFTIHPAEPYGLDGLPFHKFEMKRGD